MFQMYADFEIPVKSEEKALKQLYKYNLTRDSKETIGEAFIEHGWDIHLENDKWTDLQFLGEKYKAVDDTLFGVVAPFVPKYCYIQMQGEEGEMWRWSFDGENCLIIQPEIYWPTIEEAKSRLNAIEEVKAERSKYNQ